MGMNRFLLTLDELWRRGELEDLEQDLDRFIHTHLGEIRRALKNGRSAALDVARRRFKRGEITARQFADFCVRSILQGFGSCNPRRDIEEQKVEIEREVRIESERRHAPVPADRREQIAQDWAFERAPHWRERRLFEMLYVWNRKADKYLSWLALKG